MLPRCKNRPVDKQQLIGRQRRPTFFANQHHVTQLMWRAVYVKVVWCPNYYYYYYYYYRV